jgi:nucleosome binding factor SPN SPT16 subunit
MVFVYKNHKKEPIHINSVPVTKLDFVKEWLDSVEIPFCESKVNFNWTNILKTVDSDPIKFYEMGGWTFLEPDNNVK